MKADLGKVRTSMTSLTRRIRSARWELLGLLVLSGTVYGAYLNSLWAPPVFDGAWIFCESTSLRSSFLSAIADGERPLVALTFTANYWMGGDSIWVYHITNMTIHLFAALAGYALVKLLLGCRRIDPRVREQAKGIAFCAACIWAIHPLQTQSVTYLIQRAEVLMGLFYILTVLCGLKGCRSQEAGRKGAIWWFAAATLFSCLGMYSKKVMVTAPCMVLVLDRWLVSDSWRKAACNHWKLYLGLLFSLASLFVIDVQNIATNPTVGFGVRNISPLQYLQSQPLVILHYLRLAVWPSGLCLDYMWPISAEWPEILLPSVVVAPAAALACLGIARNYSWGPLGAWFFMILLPTSSFIPIADIAFEHRMYLSLGALVVGIVVACYKGCLWVMPRRLLSPRRLEVLGAAALAAVLVSLGAATIWRNHDYRSDIAIWEDTAAKRPRNPRAAYNLGISYHQAGRVDDAMAEYRRAVAISPWMAGAHNNLGCLLRQKGRDAEAAQEFELAMMYGKDEPRPANNLMQVLLAQHRTGESFSLLLKILRKEPDQVYLQFMAGELASRLGLVELAAHHYREALRIFPGEVHASVNLAMVLDSMGQLDEAVALCERVVQTRPTFPIGHNNLGVLVGKKHDSERALQCYRKAIELAPTYADAHNNLGLALYLGGQCDEGLSHMRESIRLEPGKVLWRINLGTALMESGKLEEAKQAYLDALSLDSRNSLTHFHLIELYRLIGDEKMVEWHRIEAVRIGTDLANEHLSRAKGFLEKRRVDLALVDLRLGLEVAPMHAEILMYLAHILAVYPDPRFRDPPQALTLARQACEAGDYKDPFALNTLAAAHSALGEYALAAETMSKAIHAAEARAMTHLIPRLKATRDRYLKGLAYQPPEADGATTATYAVTRGAP